MTSPFPFIRGLRVAEDRPPVVVSTPLDLLPERLLSAGEFQRSPDGHDWDVCWRNALTSQWFPLTSDRVAQQVTHGRMLGEHVDPPTRGELEAVTSRLVALLDEREARAARVETPAPTQSLAAAVAGRIARRGTVRAELGGPVLLRERPADPVLTRQPFDELPTPPPMPGSNESRQVLPSAEVELTTPDQVREYVQRHYGLLQANEHLHDWAEVAAELRAIATTVAPRPGWWLRRRTTTP